MDAATTQTTTLPDFFTDAELRERWRCSEMKIWRLRNRGVLKSPVKLGGVGVNLTRREDVLAVESGEAANDPENAKPHNAKRPCR